MRDCVGCGLPTNYEINGKPVCWKCERRLDSALYRLAVVRARQKQQPETADYPITRPAIRPANTTE